MKYWREAKTALKRNISQIVRGQSAGEAGAEFGPGYLHRLYQRRSPQRRHPFLVNGKMWSSSALRAAADNGSFRQTCGNRADSGGNGRKSVLLLDDVLSELDGKRQKYLMESIEGLQAFWPAPASRMLSAVIWAGKTCFMWKRKIGKKWSLCHVAEGFLCFDLWWNNWENFPQKFFC